jgi:hypothetical protein
MRTVIADHSRRLPGRPADKRQDQRAAAGDRRPEHNRVVVVFVIREGVTSMQLLRRLGSGRRNRAPARNHSRTLGDLISTARPADVRAG